MSVASSRLAVLLLLLGCAPRATLLASPGPRLSHGVAVGDVSTNAAVVWARCDRPSTVSARWNVLANDAAQTGHAKVTRRDDLVGKIAVANLQPGTVYEYRVWCGDDESAARIGIFSTAPLGDREVATRFAFGGDLGGQNACRDLDRGYPIFDTIRAHTPEFFVALGDMIYADDACMADGRFGNQQVAGPPAPALTRSMFHAIWRYNRSDAAFQRLLAATSIYPVWDDHEIKNDAGPLQDTLPSVPGTHLLGPALQAYLDYQPLVLPDDAPTRLYRSARWGKHLELFILDLRQYRDANSALDAAEQPKTMLGETQRRWLLDALQRSDATWKIIVSSVPLSVPTGAARLGHDGWTGFGDGDGFEHELGAILEAMRASTPRNYLWITTDVHFGAVFHYAPFPHDAPFGFHEIISGPLNAGVFPQDAFDRRLGADRLFRYGPETADAIANYEEAISWFNFGLVEISADGELTAKLINGNDEVVYVQTITPR